MKRSAVPNLVVKDGVACAFCEGGDEYSKHDACRAEFERREDTGICLRCGTRKAAGDGLWCDVCRAAAGGDPPFVGYPPGGS